MSRVLMAFLAAAAASLATPAQAQGTDELTLFGRGHFAGARQTVTGPTRSMSVPFTVRSVALPEGTSWELCTGNTFTGCRRFSKSVPTMAMTVRSVRPVGAASATVGTASPAAGTSAASAGVLRSPPSPSLRGMASEFFVAPERAGRRIEVQPGAAPSRADEFCRSIGWGSAAYQDVQIAGATAYLTDVLCVRTGG